MSLPRTEIPGNAGSSISSNTSMGSPSAAFVCGRNPKSYGNCIPAGSVVLYVKMPCSVSKLNLLRLPAGVSIITWDRFPLSTGFSFVGFCRDFINPHLLGLLHGCVLCDADKELCAHWFAVQTHHQPHLQDRFYAFHW